MNSSHIKSNDFKTPENNEEKLPDKSSLQKQFFQSVLNGQIKDLGTVLDNGANVNALLPMGENALFWAINKENLETCTVLIEHGINVNNKTSIAKETPLMCAARKGNVGIIQALVAAGASLTDTNIDGNTALIIARETSHLEATSLLVSLTEAPSPASPSL